MKKLNNKKGISLIVLVITIIVMIVLAAAIILSLSSSGVIGRANEAQKKSDYANAKQVVSLAQGNWLLDEQGEGELSNNYSNSFGEYAESELKKAGYTITDEITDDKLKPGSYEVTDDGIIYVYPTIPVGFVASKIDAEDEVSEGLVIYELNDSETAIATSEWSDRTGGNTTLLDVHEERNQYVWIPVNNIKEFVRKDGYYDSELQTYVSSKNATEPYSYSSLITETNDSTGEYAEYAKMKTSVEKYGGFYIARYEAGLPEGKTTSDITATDLPVTKKEVNVWNYEGWGVDIKTIGTSGIVYLSRSVYPERANKDVVSTLCYGVQYDAVMNFMDDVPNPTVPGKKYIEDSTSMGWYSNNYSSGNPNWKTGKDLNVDTNSDGTADLFATNKVKNIYDIAGHVWEWTMEAYTNNYRVMRGGYRTNLGSKSPASTRRYDICMLHGASYGFRVTLYLK